MIHPDRSRPRFAFCALALCLPLFAADSGGARLKLTREGNFLTISGDAMPGPVTINYLEAYCRPGSTDADWRTHTVIRHTAELVEAASDGTLIKLRDTLADGVVVEHTITAGADEVDFRLTARNPTDQPSLAHWAQPCVRLDQFTGCSKADALALVPAYARQCFLFIDGRLTRLPTEPWATEARYKPGQVYCPAHVDRSDVNPRPLSPLVPSSGLCGAYSADGKMILAMAWEPYQEIFQGVIACLHNDFRIGGLKPRETKSIRGKIYLVPANESALLARFERDFPEQARPPAASASNALSDATLKKIAGLRPLFDGRTLDGWIQTPAPLNFAREDVVDVAAIVARLRAKADPVSAWLYSQFDEPGRATIDEYVPNGMKPRDTPVVLRNLNQIVTAQIPLYDPERFRGVALRPDSEAALRRNPRGTDLARLNRQLLEDAFPEAIVRRPAVSWVVKDGAMASTGAGRGVIYTTEDFTRYRLIFTMRHVAGNPDHQPCVLVFGVRPAPGERALDALGGIQFQTPNGGHWDYRPGHNNAGDAFTRPVRTTFDNHQWHQVEILVDATTGVARMAVAQPVGTRATLNCIFQDPAAGRPGPIAWQMHNAGLFDEFKDVRIEIDPKEDRLITLE